MKICPKCKFEHNKSGKFCSRSCANSRIWTEDDKKNKSLAASNSIKVKIANIKKANIQKKRQKNPDNWTRDKCKVCKLEFDKLKSSIKKTCSSECFKLLPMGGLRHNSGIGKSGWYKGFWLNSTYELAYVIFHIENNIPIKRCNEFFYYLDPKVNKIRKYFPDFIVNDQIVEIKGFKTATDIEKIKSCNAKLLCKEDLKDIFKYVENSTGLKIENLYLMYDNTAAQGIQS